MDDVDFLKLKADLNCFKELGVIPGSDIYFI